MLAGALEALAVAWAAAATRPGVVRAADPPPRVDSVSPTALQRDGQPFKVTISGSRLAAVTEVNLVPLVPGQTFSVYSDTTVLVTLPADTPPGVHSVRVTSAAGSSDPLSAPAFSVVLPPPLDAGVPATPLPVATPAPRPPSPSPVAPAPATARSATGQPAATAVEGWRTPVLFTALGLLLGVLGSCCGATPGRVGLARRRGPLAQLVLRPVQRLRLGRICVHCGRLHLRWRTRRDLWKAGMDCSATCFVASQEADIAAGHGGAVAEDRLQGVLVNPARDAAAHLATHGPPAGTGDAAGGGGKAGADPGRPPLGEDAGRGTATTPLFGQPAPLGLLPGSFSLPPHDLQRELDRRHAEALHHSVELQRALDARFAADLERALQADLGDHAAPAGNGPRPASRRTST